MSGGQGETSSQTSRVCGVRVRLLITHTLSRVKRAQKNLFETQRPDRNGSRGLQQTSTTKGSRTNGLGSLASHRPLVPEVSTRQGSRMLTREWTGGRRGCGQTRAVCSKDRRGDSHEHLLVQRAAPHPVGAPLRVLDPRRRASPGAAGAPPEEPRGEQRAARAPRHQPRLEREEPLRLAAGDRDASSSLTARGELRRAHQPPGR